MKTSIKYFDLASTTTGRTIDLAAIMGVRAMDIIDTPIKIKIESKPSQIYEIPVRIINEVDQILSRDLEALVEHKIASKTEFRTWKKISAFLSI